jgi:hypothetical protein
MPRINPKQLMTARQTLLGRCCVCAHFVNWRHDKDVKGLMFAACCGLFYRAEPTGDMPYEFEITSGKSDPRNLLEWKRRT